MAAEPTVIRGACPHDCPDTCAWEVTVRDGVAEKLVGVKEHPFTRGGLCAKVSHFLERTYSPDRLRQPLMRTGPKGSGAFEPVSWDVALAHIGERLGAIVEEHGGEAVLPYSFAGTQGLVQGASMDRRFFARLGACRLERTICGQAAAAGQLEAAGTLVGMRPFDLLHSRFIVLWGTNTIVTNLHQWPIVQQARKAGARVVVIDPLLTRTAAAADWHVRPLPGTDAALALGLMHVIVAEDLHDADYVAAHTEGFERLAAELAAWSPARTQEVTGVAADKVVAPARA
jgi:anaerobic selenocysteine-containing dehydrogenase